MDKHTIEGEHPVRLCNYTDVYKNERVTSGIEFMQASALPREIEKFQVRMGDVLATKDSEDPHDIAVSALIRGSTSQRPLWLSSGNDSARPQEALWRVLGLGPASKQIRAQYEAQAVGVTRFAL